MSDQSNNVSGGLSLMPNTARPGQAVAMIGREATHGNVTAFSNDLDQARQQQHDKTRAQPSQSGNSMASRLMFADSSKNPQPSATMGQMTQSDVGRIGQASQVDVPEAASVAGSFTTTDTDELANVLQAKTIQGSIGEANQNAVMAIDSQSKLPVTATVSEKDSGIQASNTEAIQRLQQQSAAVTPFVSVAASETRAPAPNSGIRNGAVGEVVTQSTLAGRSRHLTNGLHEGGLSPDSLTEEQSAAGVAGRLMPTEINEPTIALLSETIQRPNDAANTEAMQPSAAPTPVVSDVASNMTSPATFSGVRNEAVGEIVTQGTLAGRSRQMIDSLQKNTTLANAPGFSRGNLRWSGDGANTTNTAPEALPSGLAVKSPPVQANAMGQTQVTSGNATVTQATLVGRLQQQINDGAAKNGAEVLQMTGNSGLLQTGTSPLNAHGLERLTTSETLLPNNSLPGVDSMIEIAGANKGVQQRIAATEAMQSQMALEAGNTVVRAPAADNLLLAMSGGPVAASTLQHTDSVAGPMIQAPLNIPLNSTDAETALAGNVKWMTSEGVKNAVMTVTPQGMGPISIKIGIDGNQMDVSIIASQHTTRDALESMLPRLREQLAVQGHESVKVDVSDGKSDQSRSGSGHTFADSRNPSGATSQDNQNNSSKQGEKREYGGSEHMEVVSEGFMAEDLQRVAARVVGEVDGRPVFDAYV